MKENWILAFYTESVFRLWKYFAYYTHIEKWKGANAVQPCRGQSEKERWTIKSNNKHARMWMEKRKHIQPKSSSMSVTAIHGVLVHRYVCVYVMCIWWRVILWKIAIIPQIFFPLGWDANHAHCTIIKQPKCKVFEGWYWKWQNWHFYACIRMRVRGKTKSSTTTEGFRRLEGSGRVWVRQRGKILDTSRLYMLFLLSLWAF